MRADLTECLNASQGCPLLEGRVYCRHFAEDFSLLLCWQGLEIVFRVGLAILQMNQAELIQLDMEGMLQV